MHVELAPVCVLAGVANMKWMKMKTISWIPRTGLCAKPGHVVVAAHGFRDNHVKMCGVANGASGPSDWKCVAQCLHSTDRAFVIVNAIGCDVAVVVVVAMPEMVLSVQATNAPAEREIGTAIPVCAASRDRKYACVSRGDWHSRGRVGGESACGCYSSSTKGINALKKRHTRGGSYPQRQTTRPQRARWRCPMGLSASP
eukprot:Opistho-2@20988